MLKVVSSKELDKSLVKRILVRGTNWVGDAIMTLPAIEAVRENFPLSTISVLAKPWVVPLYENHPAVDKVIPFKKHLDRSIDWRDIIRVVRLMRRSEFDLAILFQNAFEAALLAFFGGVKYRLGYNTDGRGLLLTHRVVRDEAVLKVHQVEYYLCLLRALGWKAQTRDPNLVVGEQEREGARRMLGLDRGQSNDFVLGLSPGAIYGEAKRWPFGRFAQIGDWAAERWGAKVVIFGARKETDICASLAKSMIHRPLNVCGQTTLGQVMGLISQCQFFVTNDSGLMHMAAALDVPTIAVFGSTDPVTTGPRGRRARIVRHETDCAPCLKPKCPTDHHCMLSITPEEVWEEMEDLRRTVQ